MRDPIFIIGVGRTGSKIYMNILNQHPDVNISPEMHFWTPVHRDFLDVLEEEIGDLEKEENLEKLMEYMFTDKFRGRIWMGMAGKNTDEIGISQREFFQIDREKLKKRIAQSDKSPRSLLKIFLEEHAASNNKKIPGAKFPVHFSKLPYLLDWFPDCKILYLVRDPRAIAISNKRKKRNRNTAKKKMGIFGKSNFLIDFMLINFSIHSFRSSYKAYKEFEARENVILMRYESTVMNPEKTLKKLSTFLDIASFDQSSVPPVVQSSYGLSSNEKGFDKTRMNNWKKEISPLEKFWIDLWTRKSARNFGYKMK